MQNLQAWGLTRRALNIADEDTPFIEIINDKVYVLRSNELSVYEDGPGELLTKISVDSADVIQFDYLPQEGVLWIASKSAFIYVNLSDKSVHELKSEWEPFEFDSAEWNHTKHAFVAVKSTGEISVFEINFEADIPKCIGSCNLFDNIIHTEELGWGSAERQFRSPEELSQMETLKFEVPIREEDESIYISWRGNSEQFVVNYQLNGMRKMRVYAYPCELLSESEDIIGLQAAVAWKPTGLDIAAVIWTSKRCQLAIIEKNSMFKSSFDLHKIAYVEKLAWSPNGALLAVQQAANESSYMTIDIYWFCNGTMSLKQRLEFQEINPLQEFKFLPSSDSLFVLRAITLFEAFTYTFKMVYYCSQNCTNSNAICASINGNKISITRCTMGMKPPPACNFSAEIANPINNLLFDPVTPKLALVDCRDVVTTFDITDTGLKLIRSYELTGEGGFLGPLKYQQFCWLANRIFCAAEQPSPQSNKLNGYYLKWLDESPDSFEFNAGKVYRKNINIEGLIQIRESSLLGGDIVTGIRRRSVDPSIAKAITHIYMRSVVVNGDIYVFSLSADNKFFINDQPTAEGVTSFIIFNEYLFVTLGNGVLCGIRINKYSVDKFMKKELAYVYSRNIEIGAMLLCGIPDTPYLVLQILPRGNLELCACRIISIDQIDALLDEEKWSKALDVVRTQRINYNVLIDLNMDRFLAGVGNFVKAVGMPSFISEFLQNLESTNIFSTAYSNCATGLIVETKEKRNLVCQSILNFLEHSDYKLYVNPIVTAHLLKESNTSIKDALQYVQGLLECISTDTFVLQSAMEAFRNVEYIKSNTDVFKEALLTYNLDLILFVASNIEMDPLEYEPFLNDLKAATYCRQRFMINDKVENFADAYTYLVKSHTNCDEVLNYIRQHNLYEQAVWCVKPNTELYFKVCNTVAGYLGSQRRFEEAGAFFRRANKYNMALTCYKTALEWKEAIELMSKLKFEQDKQFEVLSYIAANLNNVGRFEEASEIFEEHLNNYEMAIKICLDNQLFARGVTLAVKHQRKDILASDVVEAILLYSLSVIERCNQLLAEFISFKKRLLALREEKRNQFEYADPDDNIAGGGDYDDVGSIISTSTVRTTTASTSSRSSSRSRRKLERKKHSTKEGSCYEDIAIVETLYDSICEVFAFGPKVKEICIIVLKHKRFSKIPVEIIIMCNKLAELQEVMNESIPDIWPPDLNNIDGTPTDRAVYKNISVLEPKYRFPPEITMGSWKIPSFPTCVFNSTT